MKNMHIHNEKDMHDFAKNFVATLMDAAPFSHAQVVALHGNLGAGKSTFVRGVAHELGVSEHVTSPTFNIMKSYTCSQGVFKHLVHIDAYRLHSEDEMSVLGWQDIVHDPARIICIEWPENIAGALPEYTKHIYFKYVSEDEREVLESVT